MQGFVRTIVIMENNADIKKDYKPFLRRGWRRINKYLVTGIFFLIWMLFFDPKDISAEMGRWKKFRELQSSELQLTKQISSARAELSDLKNNAQTIEKYAREKYLMKKDNEDLFIVPASKSAKP